MATARAQDGETGEDGTFPARDAEVQVDPEVLVLGQTGSLAVSGSGFEECPGDYVLTVRMMDDWRRSRPGQILGTTEVTIGSDGQLAATVPVNVTFEGEWNGGLTMEGGCLEETGSRFAFGPLMLGVPTTGDSLAAAGIAKPDGSESAGAFVLGSWFVQRTFVPPDKPGETPESIFHHLSAYVGDTQCDYVDVAAGDVTANGDVVVWVGLPGQPEPCRDPHAVVTFRTGQQDTQLMDQLPVQPGLAVGFRPTFPAPGTGTTATPGAPSLGSGPAPGAAVEPSDVGIRPDRAAALVDAGEGETPPWAAVAIGAAIAIALTAAVVAARRRRAA